MERSEGEEWKYLLGAKVLAVTGFGPPTGYGRRLDFTLELTDGRVITARCDEVVKVEEQVSRCVE